jgi:hypothetical protein
LELRLPFPPAWKRLFKHINFINFEVLSIYSDAWCSFQRNFYVDLLAMTILPLLVCVVLVLLYACWAAVVSRKRKKRAAAFKAFISDIVLLMLFLVYPSVSNKIFRLFGKEEFDDGSVFLRADHSLDASTAQYDSMVAYGFLMILIFPIGVPLLFFVLLVPYRRQFWEADEAQREAQYKAKIEDAEFSRFKMKTAIEEHNKEVLLREIANRDSKRKVTILEAANRAEQRLILLPRQYAFLYEQYQPRRVMWPPL